MTTGFRPLLREPGVDGSCVYDLEPDRWNVAERNVEALAVTKLPVASTHGVAGILRSDERSRLGTMILDYAGTRLLFF